MPTPHLPAEIHNIISSYLAHEELQSYRQTSKRLADIGAQYLFRNPSFHASHASLARIVHISGHGTLKDAVQSVTWDTSSFSLDAWDFSDWQARIRVLRRRELAKLRAVWEAQFLDHASVEGCMQRFLWEQYEHYARLVAEEQDVQTKHLASVSSLLSPFPRLKTIVLERKIYGGPHAGPEDLELKSAELVRRGMLQRRGRMPYRHGSDMFPFVTALRAAQSSTRRIEARTLNFGVFGQGPYMEHLHPIDVSLITHLHLRFSLSDPGADPLENSMSIMNCRHVLRHGHVKTFLSKFENMQVLRLDFDARSRGNGRAPVDLADVFEDGPAWPNLRELTVLHTDTPAPKLAALLSSHASTLRSLCLGDICFDPPASWESLLTGLQHELLLEHAEFSYFLFDARVENFVRGRSALMGWYVDPQACVELGRSDLGERLGRYMVEGGMCPLWEQRKIARVVGRMEEGQVEDWVQGRNVSVVT